MAKEQLSGIWQSHYRFMSSSRNGEYEAWHYLKVYQNGDQLVAESLPGVNPSYLLLRLSRDGDVLTGSWQETTDPDGHYKGSTYHGAIQLIINDDGNMEGKWVGASKDRTIKTGPWELTYVGAELPADVKSPGVAPVQQASNAK